MIDKLNLTTLSEAELERLAFQQGGIKLALTELARRKFNLLSGRTSSFNAAAHASSLDETMQMLGRFGGIRTELAHIKRSENR
jgi:hypothetical protein